MRCIWIKIASYTLYKTLAEVDGLGEKAVVNLVSLNELSMVGVFVSRKVAEAQWDWS